MAPLSLPKDRRDWLLTLGVLSVAAGFVLIGLAWNGAAGKDSIQEQFPYVISGGLGGLGLLITGAAVIVLQAFRRDHDRVSAELADLRETIARTLTQAVVAAAEETVAQEPVDVLRFGDDDDKVVAGKASYHRPECRLAQGRTNGMVSLAEAQALGLRPCRVCDPA